MNKKLLNTVLGDVKKVLEGADPLERRRIYEKLAVLKDKLADKLVESTKGNQSADFLDEK